MFYLVDFPNQRVLSCNFGGEGEIRSLQDLYRSRIPPPLRQAQGRRIMLDLFESPPATRAVASLSPYSLASLVRCGELGTMFE